VSRRTRAGERDLLLLIDPLAMKTLCLIACLALLAAFAVSAQAPAAKPEDEQLFELVKQVQEQQAQIVSNQKKIDGKLADIAEAIRTARIFSSRGR
jgi:hypothetical protein